MAAKRTAAKATPAAPRKRTRKAPARRGKTEPEFHGRVVSVFGPFNSRALIEVSDKTLAALFKVDAIAPRSFGVIDAIDRELAEMRKLSPDLADSAIAAGARALAYEIEHPYNSLTSKAAAMKELREDMDRLRELAPPKRERNRLDELREEREQRLAAGSSTAKT